MVKKYEALFRNRWRAVLWSLGILLTAYCTVPSQDGREDPIIGLIKASAGAHHKQKEALRSNPWAVDKHQG